MMFGDLIEKNSVTLAESKKILKDVTRANYIQKQSLEYTSKFAKVSKTKAGKLKDEILETGIPRIKDRHIVKLVDLMPKTHDEIRAIFAKEELTLTKKDMDNVLEVLGKYR